MPRPPVPCLCAKHQPSLATHSYTLTLIYVPRPSVNQTMSLGFCKLTCYMQMCFLTSLLLLSLGGRGWGARGWVNIVMMYVIPFVLPQLPPIIGLLKSLYGKSLSHLRLLPPFFSSALRPLEEIIIFEFATFLQTLLLMK